MRVDRSRATLTRTQTRNLQQDLNLSQTLNSQGKRSGMHGEWDDIHSFGALETFGGTPPSPAFPEGRRLPGPWEGLWGSSSPVGTVAHRGQHPCLVQVSREAVQHPPFLDAVLLAQTFSQSLDDDTVWHCRGRRIRARAVANNFLVFLGHMPSYCVGNFGQSQLEPPGQGPSVAQQQEWQEQQSCLRRGNAAGDLGPRLSHLNKTPSSI